MALLQPARIRILTVGKLKRAWIADGVAFYRKRLPGLELVELKDSTPAKEADAIRAARRPSERLVLLSEEGQQLNSVALAELLGSWASERMALVIGGADGHDPLLKRQADAKSDRGSSNFASAPVGGFHDSGPASGTDDETVTWVPQIHRPLSQFA